MSVSIDPKNGVKFKDARTRGLSIVAIIFTLEAVFSFFLYLTLASRIFAPVSAQGAAGVPELISYQGMLTDSSGNPLGGTGTVYCFRYAIFDAASSGNQLWPGGTPTNSTTTVVDGVFSDQLGRVDSLSGLDFTSTSTYYLQVQVNTTTSTCTGTWENLTPRQQITSDAWSQTAQSVYGNSLRIATSTKVQIGTAAGSASSSMTVLSLDVDNRGDEAISGTCTNNGSLWYDSTMSRALICEGGQIQAISNSSTTIAGVGTDGNAPIMAGNVVFSDSNGVSWGQNGSTITASVNVGNLPTYLTYNNRQLGASTTVAPGQNSVWVTPFRVNGGNVSASTILVMQSFSAGAATLSSSATTSWGQTLQWGFYSNPASNSTEMDLWTTGSITMAVSHNSNTAYTLNFSGGSISSTASNLIVTSLEGMRMLTIPFGSSITPGLYAWGLVVSTAGSAALMNTAGIVYDNPMPLNLGTIPGATVASAGYGDAGTIGTSISMPATFALTAIGQVSNRVPYVKMGAL